MELCAFSQRLKVAYTLRRHITSLYKYDFHADALFIMFETQSIGRTYTMIHHARRVEFDNVTLDLSKVVFTTDEATNEEYIVFLNVKRAFYKNFHVTCDMSLETLALYVYENASVIVNGVTTTRAPDFVNHIYFNASDRDQSLIVEFNMHASVVVAKKLNAGERYYQRASGFNDFQRRHQVPAAIIERDMNVRNVTDRELEIKLYNL
ncbi:hypothetical protein [Epiphyas postvittana nucleopolyhedrovirus]|uniref:Ac57 n=1 Tax=Epiphyas postvittana nucleopolyhedrovirus TaxID=70600 RepID=Q91GJ9_NPVEP|nr:hypothetical protein [Epiphyas postvittana nucleopolyhedrovirus]AAK85616.1 unknown [Epiphyas postvittana nucleopolyhedrovirus]